jgi:NAD(P)-dependent dehydrogenase (short-subunit alcohol dehydrogenase family)
MRGQQRGAPVSLALRQYSLHMSFGGNMNPVAIVTGGTQGLGYGYVRELLKRGVRVVLTGRTAAGVDAAVQRLAQECPDASDRLAGCVCEIADLASVQSVWDFGVARYGSVDIWLNNAGYARTGVGFLETTAEEIESMIAANVVGSMNAAQVAIAGFRRQGSKGKLYLTLGGGGATGRVVPGMSVYSTTKRAVKYFADTLVKERKEARDDILIGTISPGVNVTEGLLREMQRVPEGRRAQAMKQLNFVGEHVETTTPWIIDRLLTDTRQGNNITWLTTGRMLSRGLAMLFGQKRDVITRYQSHRGGA